MGCVWSAGFVFPWPKGDEWICDDVLREAAKIRGWVTGCDTQTVMGTLLLKDSSVGSP